MASAQPASRPALCLVPGLLCDAHVWGPQLAAFDGAYDIQIPELFAFRSIEAMAGHLLAQMPARFALCGHSMGGRVALEVIRRAPERIERLALLDTGTHPALADERAKRMGLVELARSKGMAALADVWLPPMVHPGLARDGALMRGLREMVGRMTPDIFDNQQTALLTRPDARPVLDTIRCPTLVGVGRQDGWSPPARHQEIAAAIAGATLAIFEDCGHMATLEAPDAVNAAFRAWLAA
ncbi:MAG: alpha/beta fold hydrolase [Alphaproteobacteria bacterium]|nr:alpha/beta fold hydrolase [Alphaproteobacteria bacterium]